MLHCLPKNPQEENVKQIEELQQSILGQFLILEAKQAASSTAIKQTTLMHEDNAMLFDDLDDAEHSESHDSASAQSAIPNTPCRLPMMPSTLANPAPHDRLAELSLRKHQGAKLLKNLQDAIADKSFQYSHVIHIAPHKQVSNCTRKTIINLNNSISFYC